MEQTISKSRFKARAFEYFREVERTGHEIVITDRGRPVLKLVPYTSDPAEASSLRGTVVRYEDPTEAVGEEDWEALRAESTGPDETLLDMGLRLTPAQRLRWLEETVEELLPWVGLAGLPRSS